jgi:multidrug efflux pump subunit AcrA (membrane-fusion protein)
VPVLTFFGGKVADVTSRVGDLVKENAPLLTVTSAPGGDEKTITSPAAGTLIRLYVEPGQLLPPNDKNVVGLIQIRKPDLTARGLREILTDPHVSPAQRKLAGDALELMAKLRRDGPDVEERGKGRLALVSPVSGKVLYVNEAFSYRTQFPADTLAFLIGRDDSMIVQFGVPEFSLDKVRPGQTVAVTVGENDTRAFPGRLEMIQSAPDARRQGPVARYTALASVENPGSVLKHGANCRVSITLESRKNVLLLPVEFVHEGNGWYVDVVDGEGVRRQDVTVGLVAEGKVEIASGLREGQRVSIGTP